jgi:hypothetical protein
MKLSRRQAFAGSYDSAVTGAAPGSATLLPTGNVLLTLVTDDLITDDTMGSTALYNPSTVTFSPAPDVMEGTWRIATLLGDGTVFIAGLNYK